MVGNRAYKRTNERAASERSIGQRVGRGNWRSKSEQARKGALGWTSGRVNGRANVERACRRKVGWEKERRSVLAGGCVNRKAKFYLTPT
jgi:hypothetical protein